MRRIAAWACGAGVVAGVAIAVLAARHAHPAEVSPVRPGGSWNAAWVAGLACAFAFYVIAVALLWRNRSRARAALAVAVVVQALPLAAPLLLSKDVYLYWLEARIVTVHHTSPYRTTPADVASDPATPFVSEAWLNEVAPYGPTWETLGLTAAAAAGTDRAHAVTAYKLLSFAGVLAALLVVFFATGSAAAVAVLGWSPLIALHFAGGGHSDGWLVALICAGTVAGGRAHGGVAWSLGAAFKPVAAILFPLDLAATHGRRPRAFWIGLLGASVAVVAASGLAWGTGWIHASLVGVHGASPLGGVHWLTELGLSHRDAVLVGGLVYAAVYVVLLRLAWRDGRPRLALAAAALCLTTSLLRPWYAIWPLALAAVEVDTVAVGVAIALSAYLLFADAVSL
jgi:hypothetical protein